MKERTRLKEGFTTGTAFAAAVKGALALLLGGERPDRVRVDLPGSRTWTVPLHRLDLETEGRAVCTVIKDAGDDPDLTHGAEVGAVVEVGQGPLEPGPCSSILNINGLNIIFIAGEGVGTVTRPGLPLPPGEPAINPGPRRLTGKVVREAVTEYNGLRPTDIVSLTAFVARGKELAAKTLNPKLGIVGGLSILGTTGVVRPYSHAAYRATIVVELRAARASGLREVVLATGRTSERLAGELLKAPDLALIRMGDHLSFCLRQAREEGFERVVVAAFFGKTVKMAQGSLDLRFDTAPMNLAPLAELTARLTEDRDLADSVAGANTARMALELLQAAKAGKVIQETARLAHLLCARILGDRVGSGYILFEPGGRVLYNYLTRPEESGG